MDRVTAVFASASVVAKGSEPVKACHTGTNNAAAVAKDTVEAIKGGKDNIFVHPLFRYVSLAFQFIPQAIFRRLPF